MPPGKGQSAKDKTSTDSADELKSLRKWKKDHEPLITKQSKEMKIQEVQIHILRHGFVDPIAVDMPVQSLSDLLQEVNKKLNAELKKLRTPSGKRSVNSPNVRIETQDMVTMLTYDNLRINEEFKKIHIGGGANTDEMYLKRQIETLHKEIDSLKGQIEDLERKQKQVPQSEKEKSDLQIKGNEANERSATRDSLQREDASLKEKLADTERKIEKLEADLSEQQANAKEKYSQELADIQKKHKDELDSQEHTLNSTIEQLRQQLKSVQHVSGAETSGDQLPDQSRIQELEEQLNAERNRSKTLEKEMENKSKTFEREMETNSKTFEREMETKSKTFEQEMNALQGKLENEQLNRAKHESAKESAETDLQTANNQIVNLQEEVNDLKRTKDVLEKEINTVRRQKEKIEQMAKDVTERGESASADGSRKLFKEQLREKEEEVKSIKANSKSECDELKAKVKRLEAEVSAQKDKFSDLQKKQHDAFESLRKKDSELKDLKEEHKKLIDRKEDTINKLRREKSSLESAPSKNTKGGGSIGDLTQQLRLAQDEINNLKNRLSKVVGAKISDDNPNIADLSDENRPTKLGEKYSELYDNEWTDAYEEIEAKVGSESKVIETLRTELININKYCKAESEKYTNRIKQSAMSMKEARKQPVQVDVTRTRQLKDLKKSFAPLVANDVYESYKMSQAGPAGQQLDKFRKKCVEVCWLMSVQDPPVVLDDDVKHKDNKFDSDRYRSYTKGGNKLDYVVWPPMLLHEGGAMLCKGVAQGK